MSIASAYDVKEAIDFVHQAGGVAVLAHPYHLIKDDMEKWDAAWPAQRLRS